MTFQFSAARLARACLAVIAASAALLLVGCYESDVSVIATGETASIAGKYACRLLIDGKQAFELAITVADHGAYRFAATDVAGSVKLKRLHGGRYLLQLSDDEYPDIIYYAYGEATGATGFRTFYPRRDDKAFSAAAMQKYAVRFFGATGHEDVTGATVKAEPAALMRFLADPAVHELKDWFTCKRA